MIEIIKLPHRNLKMYGLNVLGDRGSIPGRVIPKTEKMVLDPSLIIDTDLAYKGKWSNPGKRVAPPTSQCSSHSNLPMP